MTEWQDISSFLTVIGLAVFLDHFAHMDGATFIASSALWYGIRAWSRATPTKDTQDKTVRAAV